MRIGSRLLAFFAAALLLSAASVVQASDGTPATLVFQGAVKGQIEDCGCKKKPLGGLAARSVILDHIRAEHPSLALIDAGNLMGAQTEEGRQQSEFLVQETVGLGYAAVGVGTNDLRLGTDFLRRLEDQYGLGYTSANLYDGASPLFTPFEIIEAGGVRIGVVSVHDAQLELSTLGEEPSVELRDPTEALAEWLPKVRAKADVVVLLSHLRPNDLKPVLTQLGESHRIDFVVEGVGRKHLARMKQMGSTVYVSANDQGKYLGQLDFFVQDDGTVSDVQYTLHEVHPTPQDDAIAARVAAFKERLEGVATTLSPATTQ